MSRERQYDEATLNSKVDSVRVTLRGDIFEDGQIEIYCSTYRATLRDVLRALNFMDQRHLSSNKGGRKNKVDDIVTDFLKFGTNEYRIRYLLELRKSKTISTRTYYRILAKLLKHGIDARRLIAIMHLWESFHILTYIIKKEADKQEELTRFLQIVI